MKLVYLNDFILFIAPEERQQDVRQLIESRPLFGSPSTLNNSTPVSSSRSKKLVTPLTRSGLGIKPKEDGPSTSSLIEPIAGSSSSPTKLLGLCDYASSSEDSH